MVVYKKHHSYDISVPGNTYETTYNILWVAPTCYYRNKSELLI